MEKKIEILLLKIAKYIVYDRNVKRSKFISRRDNNKLFDQGIMIESIIDRMEHEYKNLDKYPNY